MFAGPNGSGKSTIKALVRPDILGTYINPDEIAAALYSQKGLDFHAFGVELDRSDLMGFFENSNFIRESGALKLAEGLEFVNQVLYYREGSHVGYLASALADHLRRKMLAAKQSFAFETVMSSRDKVELLREAQREGYRTYLYFVATEDPRINVKRVANRVLLGGHDVPEQKIYDRYYRCLELVAEATYYSNRA